MKVFEIHSFGPAIPQVVWAKNSETKFVFRDAAAEVASGGSLNHYNYADPVTTFSQSWRLGSLDIGEITLGLVVEPEAKKLGHSNLSNPKFIKDCFESVTPFFVGPPGVQAKGAEFVARVYGLLGAAQRDWVGIYWRAGVLALKGLDSALLVGPYWGPLTPHTIISEQKGLCGRAIRENRTLNIEDVTKDSDFLACSISTKSEIVIPIALPDGEVVAELDIDSNQFKAFDMGTQKMLEQECLRFGVNLSKQV